MIIIVVVAVLLGVGYAWFRYQYPYGFSHCCLKGLGAGLREYAEKHNGRFPEGEKSPEASLSLLYADGPWGPPDVLRGKTVPLDLAKNRLERGELLSPDTCGWHYVEGLTLRDDYRIAIVWDKIGLNHNGGRLPEGGHSVLFVDGFERIVSGSEWPQFLREQKRLLAARSREAIEATPLLSAKVRLPSGEIVDHFDGPYTLSAEGQYESAGGSGTAGGTRGSADKLVSNSLRWWHLAEFGMGGAEKGTLTLTLTLGSWPSKPVQIRVSNRVPTPRSFVFELATARTGTE
jgi:hypothetical protein